MLSFESWGHHDEAQHLKYYMHLSSTSAPIISTSSSSITSSATASSPSASSASPPLDLEALEKRISELEAKQLKSPQTPGRRGVADPNVRRVYDAVKSNKQVRKPRQSDSGARSARTSWSVYRLKCLYV